MKYRCIPCDHEFEAGVTNKPRCPRCMTIHDIEPVADSAAAPAASGKQKFLGAAVLLGILAIGIAAWFLTADKTSGVDQSGKSSSGDGLKERLAELSLERSQIVDPCAADDAVKAWVEKVAPGDGAQAAEKLHTALLRGKEQGLWRPHPQREPRKEPPLTASKLAQKLQDNIPEAPYEALSYELSCLLVAACRVAQAPAKLAEVLEFEGEEAPADPEGRLGRYAVAVGGGQDAFLLDPYSGRAKQSAKGRTVILDHLQEAAPYYGIAALSRLVSRETPEAIKLNDAALSLDGRSGWLRMGRGLILAATGAIEEAINEMERAIKAQDEPPLLVDLAEIQLLTDPSGRSAQGSLVTALSKTPKYARAKALLGMVHLMSDQQDAAKAELEEAERLDPESPSIKLLMARYLMAKSDSEGAISKAKEAVRISGNSPTALLGLAGIYGGTARFDEMRATLDELLAKVDSAAMAEEIKRMFGYEPKASPTAEAASSSDSSAAPGSDTDTGSGQFRLKLDPMGGNRASRYGLGGAGSGLDLKLDMGQK